MSLTIYFDESRVKRWGPPGEAQERIKIGNRLLIGAVVAADGPLLETSLAEQARRLLADPMAWESRPPRPDKKDRRDLFAKEHFHFTHDSLNVRQAALATMLEHSVRAHVLYTHLAWESGMNETDIQTAMYFTLLRNLLRRYAGAHVRLVFENESKMDRIYGQIVQSAIASLDRATKRKARQPRASVEARIGRKPNGGLSAVDYCLGVANLGLQVRHGDAEVPQPAAHELESVARLDRHISHVLNFDTAAHARRFDILRTPSWARHIAGVNSHPTAEKSFSTLITRGPTGLFTYVDSPEALATSIGISS